MKRNHRPSLRRLIAALPAGAQCPDEATLAAWLEGRLSDRQAEQVDTWLCHEPLWRQALCRTAGERQDLSEAEWVRALALLAPAAAVRERWFERLLAPLPAWGMAGLLAAAGFWLGSGLAAGPEREALLLAWVLTGLPL